MSKLVCSVAMFFALAFFVPTAAVAGKVDLSGKWGFTVSGSWKKGPCPVGPGGAGTLEMEQKGKKVTLVFTAGRVCRPASMCTFKGKLVGKTLKLGNSAKVDGEGGMVKNTIELTWDGVKAAKGTSSSSYTHPGGMRCSWGSKVALKKK